jgi:hypothetical protein
MALSASAAAPAAAARFAPAANQLEDLDDKFDFADAARAELDVVFQPATAHFTGDHPFMLRSDWITLKSI